MNFFVEIEIDNWRAKLLQWLTTPFKYCIFESLLWKTKCVEWKKERNTEGKKRKRKEGRKEERNTDGKKRKRNERKKEIEKERKEKGRKEDVKDLTRISARSSHFFKKRNIVAIFLLFEQIQ